MMIHSFFFCSLDSTTRTTNTALFISVPLFGHVNPLIPQALELKQRGWNVYLLSCTNIKEHIEKYGIEFIDIGYCSWLNELDMIKEKVSAMQNFADDSTTLIQWAIDISPIMYNASINILRDKQLNVTIAIVDMTTLSGTDVSDTLNIPYIINNPDILPFIEGPFSQMAAHDSGNSIFESMIIRIRNTLMRALRPLLPVLQEVMLRLYFDSRWNKHRASVGLTTPNSLMRRCWDHVVLSNSAFGLERVRSISPHIQFTGPMFYMNISKQTYLNDLSVEDRQWIELDSTKPVIYVSPGTIASLSKEQIHKLIDALSSDKYRVLWKLSKTDMHHIADKHIPESIRIVHWISSVLGHLAHPNVKMFISHCGINSVYESIWLGTPVICLPMFFDQYHMDNQVQNAGVGLSLDKFKFTSNELKTKIEQILNNNNYSRNIERVQAQMKLHGGVQRAADVIETVARFGSDIFVPKRISLPFYAKYNLDVFLIWFAVFLMIQKLIRYIVRIIPRRTNLARKNNKID